MEPDRAWTMELQHMVLRDGEESDAGGHRAGAAWLWVWVEERVRALQNCLPPPPHPYPGTICLVPDASTSTQPLKPSPEILASVCDSDIDLRV